ncbi:hypothetical protein AB6M97_01890 [Streptococcus hillyeri]|uniref:hypothetical protein n=1 Tax=Streptococcus hillyeri TaxID=2282420 RepID=UPI0034E19720
MYKLDLIANGGYTIPLGTFTDKEQIKQVITDHINSYSAVNNPKIVISGTEDCRRVDYGSCDSYYLITRKKENYNG